MRIRSIFVLVVALLITLVYSQKEDEEPEIHYVPDEQDDELEPLDVIPKNWPSNLHLPEIRNVEQFK